MSTRINTPMAEAGSGGSDDEETPAPIVVAANNKSSMTMKKKPRKPTKGGGGAARAPTRPHPEVHEHGAAVLIQARTRGNRDRTQNDFYKDKDTISSHTNATMDWLRGRCTEQREKIDKKRLHFFDYWKKYDGDDKMQPSQKLKTIGTPWCMMFTLTEDDETGEYDRLSYECVELCQRCWAAIYTSRPLSPPPRGKSQSSSAHRMRSSPKKHRRWAFSCASRKPRAQCRALIILGTIYTCHLALLAWRWLALTGFLWLVGAGRFHLEHQTHYTPNRFSPELQELGFASPFTSGHRQRLVQSGEAHFPHSLRLWRIRTTF